MTPPLRLSVPGNLLLLGEYAVTEPGGFGIALAIEPRVTVTTVPASATSIVGVSRAGEARWPGARAGLLEAVAEAVRDALRGCGVAELPHAAVRVDSRALPKGYGSSAAVAVAVAGALLGLADVGRGDLPAAVSHAALRGHRAFQGGRGSGYDVAASVRGGVGLFEGGEEPAWTPLSLDWLGPLSLFEGKAPVATPGAVARYQEWKGRDLRAASAFLAASNRAVAGFATAGGWDEAAAWFEGARALALELGRAIGVSAEIGPPGGSGLCKAVGAGNELGVLVGVPRGGAVALEVAAAGLAIGERS